MTPSDIICKMPGLPFPFQSVPSTETIPTPSDAKHIKKTKSNLYQTIILFYFRFWTQAAIMKPRPTFAWGDLGYTSR